MAKRRQLAFRSMAQRICPPILWSWAGAAMRSLGEYRGISGYGAAKGSAQDIDVYWEARMAQLLETWGEDNVWKEIRLLMVNCHGRVLDIACGTGKTIELLSGFPLEIHGCDISDLLVGKAIGRGIRPEYLTVCDATQMPYDDASFDHAYSIGSLEHFTEEGILLLLKECKRVVRKSSFHMIPVSRSDRDEGWLKTYQSFHNNSVAWWLEKYRSVFGTVLVLDSTWEDEISVGKWFVCINEGEA